MHRRLSSLAGLAVAMTLAVSGTGLASAAAPGLGSRLIASLPTGSYGSFGESLAASGGNLYVSLTVWSADQVTPNEGQVWRLAPNGKLTKFGPSLNVCILTGLAFDDLGRLYVGVYSCDAGFAIPSGVLRIDADGTSTRILTLPAGSFPNGLAFHDGYLYVSDYLLGSIWRVREGETGVTPTTPWIQSPLLAPQRGSAGVDGIAFWGDTLYAATYFGTVVQVPVGSNGTAGTPTVLVSDHRLSTADGVSFDAQGRLWVTTNGLPNKSGSLARVARDGSVTVVVDDPALLDYPAQPVFGATGSDATTLYVVNGSFYRGTPDVVAFDVGVAGQRVP